MNLLEKENRWLLVWVLGAAVAVPLSILTGYFFIFTLILLVPIAQTIALGMHPQTKGAAIWLFPVPILVPLVILIVSMMNLEAGTTTALAMAFLLFQGVGEYLLSRIFKQPLTFYYLAASLLGTAIGVGVVYLGNKLFSGESVGMQIALLSLGVAVQSAISGYAIHRFYGKNTPVTEE